MLNQQNFKRINLLISSAKSVLSISSVLRYVINGGNQAEGYQYIIRTIKVILPSITSYSMTITINISHLNIIKYLAPRASHCGR